MKKTKGILKDKNSVLASSFINDEEKMIDFKNMNKNDFLKSYSYLTESEYEATKLEYSTGGTMANDRPTDKTEQTKIII